MVQSPSWENNRLSVSQEIPSKWPLRTQNRVHNNVRLGVPWDTELYFKLPWHGQFWRTLASRTGFKEHRHFPWAICQCYVFWSQSSNYPGIWIPKWGSQRIPLSKEEIQEFDLGDLNRIMSCLPRESTCTGPPRWLMQCATIVHYGT